MDFSSNIERWKYYMQEISSPAMYIESGFYSLIASALQRRVWLGDIRTALYPNMYMLLVGEPGLGKGLVMKQVSAIIRHHRNKDTEERINGEYPLMIPVAADATTYEALVRAMSKCTKTYQYKEDSKLRIYTHSSLTFCLEEMASLFRKHTEDVANFLLVTFDCGDFIYDTKTQGTDKIKNCCLNFLAGTNPAFIKRVFNDELLSEGFSSRAVFVYEEVPRFHKLFIPKFSEDQIACHQHILDHIGKLIKLFGQVKLSPEADKFMTDWWENKPARQNDSPKLKHYYARKNIHALKMAMCHHFADSTELEIPLHSCKAALDILNRIEAKMHLALTAKTMANPLHEAATNIIELIKAEPMTIVQLLEKTFTDVKESELFEVVNYLTKIKKIAKDSKGRYMLCKETTPTTK